MWEYVEGHTCVHSIPVAPNLPVRDAWAVPIAAGCFAVQPSVNIHRDIKPANYGADRTSEMIKQVSPAWDWSRIFVFRAIEEAGEALPRLMGSGSASPAQP